MAEENVMMKNKSFSRDRYTIKETKEWRINDDEYLAIAVAVIPVSKSISEIE